MKKRYVKSPLRKRIFRELLGDWRKYLVVSMFLILTIGFVSGMYVANGSMMQAADEGVTKYKLEDGHFELSEPADETMLAAIKSGEKVYENFYRNEEEDNVTDMMFAKYQYVLKGCEDKDGDLIESKNESAEKFSMCSLQKKSEDITEEVSVYGVSDDSCYVEIDGLSALKQQEVYISRPFSDKYGLKVGDNVFLNEKYENKKYRFRVVGIYDKCQSIAVFMPIESYREVFDVDVKAFTGYMSDSEIKDIDEEYIATVITERDITKMCDQLDHSMGSYMTYFQILCILLSAVLIYLLTKIIIEKNENAISMTKILGYENREIASLYLFSTTMVLLVADVVSVILGTIVMKQAWRAIMFDYSGWYAFTMEPIGYVKMFAFVLLGYLVVMFFDFKRIKKIPMNEALKNVE